MNGEEPALSTREAVIKLFYPLYDLRVSLKSARVMKECREKLLRYAPYLDGHGTLGKTEFDDIQLCISQLRQLLMSLPMKASNVIQIDSYLDIIGRRSRESIKGEENENEG